MRLRHPCSNLTTSYDTGSPMSHDYNFPAGPAAVALADVNGDGKLDIVAANDYVSSISVLLGHGDGTFADHVDYAAGTLSDTLERGGPASITLADVDGDGHLDIVTANRGAATVSVLLGHPDGSFADQVEYPAGDGPSGVVVGDLSGDGRPDLLVVDGASPSLMLGHGDGSFAAAVEVASHPYVDVAAVADLNGDGIGDLVLGTDQTNVHQVLVMLGARDGQLAGAMAYPTHSLVQAVYVADFDGDGKPDLLARTYDAVALWLGHGDGAFGARVDLPLPYPQGGVAIGDMNSDGKLDVVLASRDEPVGAVGILLGRGDGSFGQTAYTVAYDTAAVEVGDLDGDGKLDAVTVGKIWRAGGKLGVFLGKGDGTLAVAADLDLPGEPSHVQLADVNGDGRLDIVTASSDVTTVSTLLSNGGGTFTTAATDTGTQPSAMALGDVNHDGKLDLVVLHSTDLGAGSAKVLLGRGDGTFAATTTAFISVCSTPFSASLVDVDGDGALDLIIACNGWAARDVVPEPGINVLLGNGDGTFAAPIASFGDRSFRAVAMGDLNADGILDLTWVDTYETAYVSLGYGDGSFAEPAQSTIPWGAAGVAVIDINRDGRADVVVRNNYNGGGGGSGITVLLGHGDGTLASASNYFVDAQGLAFGDLNGDGQLDLVAATHSQSLNVLLGTCR